MAKQQKEKGLGIKTRRTIAYVVLILITFFCLFWFYVLIINATRSNGELKAGFSALPSTNLWTNWKNLVNGTLPVWNGLINSVIIAGVSAAGCVYISAMTAYAFHAYQFKGKKVLFTFILAIMMIPTQVVALGFVRLMNNMKLDDTFIPLIIPAFAAPVTVFLSLIHI